MAMNQTSVIHVEDLVDVEGHGVNRKIERITVCLRPTTDPAGETHGADVEACELSLPLVVTLAPSAGRAATWAYGNQITYHAPLALART